MLNFSDNKLSLLLQNILVDLLKFSYSIISFVGEKFTVNKKERSETYCLVFVMVQIGSPLT